MTAKEYFEENAMYEIRKIYEHVNPAIIKIMQDFATLKCKEQRENCLKEAGVYLNHNDIPFISEGSILNAKQPEV